MISCQTYHKYIKFLSLSMPNPNLDFLMEFRDYLGRDTFLLFMIGNTYTYNGSIMYLPGYITSWALDTFMIPESEHRLT